MKLITFTQGADPRPGLALSDNVGLDLLAADPSLPGNWHVLFGDLDPVRRVHDQHVGRLSEMESLLTTDQSLPMPFVPLRVRRWSGLAKIEILRMAFPCTVGMAAEP